jgi:hypothetical protein
MSEQLWLAIISGAVTVLCYWLVNRNVGSVHKIVNSQRTEMMEEIKSLRKEIAEKKAEQQVKEAGKEGRQEGREERLRPPPPEPFHRTAP